MEGIRLVSAFGESRDLVLTPSRSDLVVQSSRFFWRNPRREIYSLGMVSGPVLFKVKGKSLIFILLGVDKSKQNQNKKNDEIGQMLVSGALDDTKKMRKAGADMYAKSGPEKTKKNLKKSRCSPDFSQFFL